MNDSRYIIGIDLGTTNSAVYFVDTEGDGQIYPFPVPQLTAVGEVDSRHLLPSFCYLPSELEQAEGLFSLPWDKTPECAVGTFARDHGTAVPARLIASAKSWLAHAGVDRRKPLLPWGSEIDDQKLSPVDVTALCLEHIRKAWNHQYGKKKDRNGSRCVLETQQVTVTIPASFDETARELTLEAAKKAGYQDLVLLEEPLAAFYSWLNRHDQSWKEMISPGEKILVVDVGGGTSDFSIIGMGDKGTLHRFAVGDHLLLGGDNIDMAIARKIEQEWGTKLSMSEWSMLVQLSRQAKENLLSTDKESHDITLLSRGSSVIGGAKKATLQKNDLMSLLDTGFYPACPVDAPAPKGSGGMREMGLPYASEPAVTIHLLHFLKYASHVSGGEGVLFPNKILFNGGSMIAEHVRDQVVDVIDSWFPEKERPEVIESDSLSLAVAIGAAYYGRVRRGEGVKVRGGISRSYFLSAKAGDGHRLVCVISRDTDEHVDVEVPGRFRLKTNEKVLFKLHSSATRLNDQPGDHLDESDDISEVGPLATVLQFGQTESRDIEVAIHSRLTEVGTLEVSLKSTETEHSWPLRFDLRPMAESDGQVTDVITVDQQKIDAAREVVKDAFTENSDLLPGLNKALEQTLELPREEWSLPLLRDLVDTLMDLVDSRKTSSRHEARWFNLAGYCMRPGFGDPGDQLRMRKLWRLWFEGVQHQRDPQANADFWVFWRRIAPGLGEGHQSQVAANAGKILMPQGKYRNKIKEGDQAKGEMWRCIGAMEQLSVKNKRRIGSVLLERLAQLTPFEYWVLGRLGSRRLFHGSMDAVLPAKDAGRWITTVLDSRSAKNSENMRLFALSLMAARSGDRNLDLTEKEFTTVKDYLTAVQAPESWLKRMAGAKETSSADQAKILGDTLPLGLHIIE